MTSSLSRLRHSKKKNVDILPASPTTKKNTALHIERAVAMSCSVASCAFAVLYGAVAS